MKKLFIFLLLPLLVLSCESDDDCPPPCTQEVLIRFGRQRSAEPTQINECNERVTLFNPISQEDNGDVITIGCECEPPFIYFTDDGVEWLFDDPDNPL